MQPTDIPVKILKQNADIFGSYIYYFFNIDVGKGTFPSTAVFIKRFSGSKENYRPHWWVIFRCLQNFRKAIIQPNNTFYGSVSA